MLTLVITVLFGLGFGYFATQNTAPVNIYFQNYAFLGVPMYLVILVSLLAGLIVPTGFALIKSLLISLKISKKDDQINKSKEEVSELTRRIHKLEIENTKLRTTLGKEEEDEDSI